VGTSSSLVHNSYDARHLDDYSQTAFDAIFSSQSKGYSRDAVIKAIESTHGISKLTNRQYNTIMSHLRTTVFSDVRVTYTNGRRYVDFGSWAYQGKTHQIPLAKLRPRTDLARESIDGLRSQHIRDLDSMFGNMPDMTWHHMQNVGEFQRVDARLHELFKGHRGLADWGL
jgi:hypothetical protein